MSYEEDWAEYRRRRKARFRWLVAGPLGFGLGMVLVHGLVSGFLSPLETKRVADNVAVVLAIVWALGLGFTSFVCGYWPCPRCGKPFEARGTLSNAFTSRCMNCRLPKGAATPGDPE